MGQLLLTEPGYTSSLQETMQNGISYLRAIVEVCPREQRQDEVRQWRDEVEDCLEGFGV